MCDDSAAYFGEPVNRPTALWQDPGQVYVHTNSAAGSIGSSLILCGNNGQYPSLTNPPLNGPLFDAIRRTLTGLPLAQAAERPATSVLALPPQEQLNTIEASLEKGLSDVVAMLLLNRPQLVAPMLETLLRSELTPRQFALASEMLAYSGSAEALAAIGRLIEKDEAKFGPLAARLLDHNLANGGNPFALVKRMSLTGKLERYVDQWSSAQVASPRMERLPRE